ncbi:UNVERIFIED_CONTAM: hypothetical protein PYX00_009597 [Menopon gallinae]|uniref:CRAL-TRIO domain-containing protein n=1 Tax=Menopon gallinae TaxID=328185 RepID=A0AAW2HCJ8_9NEOP
MSGRRILEEEFEKNKELKKEDFQNLKDWYACQDHLPPISDELLVSLYHSCFYKLEPTKRTIENYFSMRTHGRELFSERDPCTVNVRNGKVVMLCSFLSKRTPENHRVLLMKIMNTDPAMYVFSEVTKAFNMHYDLELYLNGTAPGDEMVIDMDGISLGHLARLNLVAAKKILEYMQEGMPVRLKRLHYINVVPFMDKIMALIRPFMNKEFMEKLVFHTEGIESLDKFVPLKIMPKNYGGSEKSNEELAEEQLKFIMQYKDWFQEEEKLRVDESKRPIKSKSFGMDGSFKKIEFD